MPRRATRTSFKPGEQHVYWNGGDPDYWRREARKITNCPSNLVVHHIDGDFTNNDISNLQILTQSKHVAIHNRQRAGGIKKNSCIRQNIERVIALKKDGMTRKDIAEILGLHPRMVKRCCTTKWMEQYE